MNSYKIVRSSEVDVNKMYTIRGFVGDPKNRNDRYIQYSVYTGEPIINTRCAYSLGRVVTFSSELEAILFINKFANHPDRKNKHTINWKIIPYRPMLNNCDYTFVERNSKYGTCYYTESIKCRGRNF